MRPWLVIGALLLASAIASADSWLPPTPQTFSSNRGTYRLTVFPARTSGGAAEQSRRCEATLERLDDNRYRELWRKPLVNAVGPVEALVSDKDGAFVTFDNWAAVGVGDDVIVVYDGQGDLRKKFSLPDILTRREIDRIPHSVSSLWWGGKHYLSHDEETIQLQIVKNRDMDNPAYFQRRLSLRTGEVLE